MAAQLKEDIHYRVHDADTGELLGFGTGRKGSLGTVVAHCAQIQQTHSGRHLVIRQYDQAAGPTFRRPLGP
ncbi:hypothetical protein [Streptomyces atriruber]|uniref:hypothetical protein n=1 Tax=Streptomyces atriruber TaxID=545121 RepID=UPI0012FF4691|nr:hypothetical protein [Streptomyces atriruber]